MKGVFIRSLVVYHYSSMCTKCCVTCRGMTLAMVCVTLFYLTVVTFGCYGIVAENVVTLQNICAVIIAGDDDVDGVLSTG